MSPMLPINYANDLAAELPHGIKVARYADYLVIWDTNEHANLAT